MRASILLRLANRRSPAALPVAAPALLLVAALAPAPLAAQDGVTVSCPEDDCHYAPFFRGSGGFVGKRAASHVSADGTPLDVTFAISCGSVIVSGSVREDTDGIVRQVLGPDTGVFCTDEGGIIELHGLEAGGWYWMNDDRSSATAALLPLGVLRNEQTRPVDPGGLAFSTFEGGTATYAKHEPTGRVGILPHVLPAPAPAGCSGPIEEAENCLLGGPGDWSFVLTTGPNDDPVSNARPIERGPETEVKVSLVGDAYLTTASTIRVSLLLAGATRGDSRGLVPAGVAFAGAAPTPVEGAVQTWTIDVPNDPARCAEGSVDRAVPQVVGVYTLGSLVGALPAWPDGDGPEAAFTIICAG